MMATTRANIVNGIELPGGTSILQVHHPGTGNAHFCCCRRSLCQFRRQDDQTRDVSGWKAHSGDVET